jgi:hypothetical protein
VRRVGYTGPSTGSSTSNDRSVGTVVAVVVVAAVTAVAVAAVTAVAVAAVTAVDAGHLVSAVGFVKKSTYISREHASTGTMVDVRKLQAEKSRPKRNKTMLKLKVCRSNGKSKAKLQAYKQHETRRDPRAYGWPEPSIMWNLGSKVQRAWILESRSKI